MTAALILAAGSPSENSKRWLTDDIGGTSSIRRLILLFRQAEIGKIVVVTGFNAEETEKHCGHLGVVFLRNNDFETGDILHSIKIGLDYLKDKCEKTFIAPADISLFSSETLKSMEDADEPVVIPIFCNRTGHPILLSRSLFDRVLEYGGSGGIGGALSGADVERRFLDVLDEGILVDTQKYDVLDSIVESHDLRRIRPEFKLSLACEKGFFGPGMLLLLTLVMEAGTLKYAAQRMGISIHKALTMIANAEEQLGFKVLATTKGGRPKGGPPKGGTSKVTEDALDIMNRYGAFEAECMQLVKESFDKHFSGMKPIPASSDVVEEGLLC